jgi:hypothetical protein
MRNIMSDPEIVMSPHCRETTGDSTRIQVDIYRGENESGWISEVTDKENTSTVPIKTGNQGLCILCQ